MSGRINLGDVGGVGVQWCLDTARTDKWQSTTTAENISLCTLSRENSTVEEDTICKDLPTNNLYVLLLVGIMVTGVGGSALNSLGVSYIDDFAHERNSPLYLSECCYHA